MPFDPNQPFDVVDESQTQASPSGFDPNQPFEQVQVTPEQKSIEDFIRQSQAGPISKIASTTGSLLNALIAKPVQSLFRVPGGVVRNFQTENPVVPIPIIGGQLNNAQSTAEGAARLLYDIGTGINQMGTTAIRNISQNPLDAALRSAIPALAIAQDLSPHTPNQQEISNFLEDQLKAKQIEAAKAEPLLANMIGKADIPLAEDLSSASTLIPLAGPIAKTAKLGARALTSPIQVAREAIAAVSPTIGARIAPAALEDSTIAALGLGKDELDVIARVPTAVERTLQTSGKIPQTAEDAIQAMKNTRKRLYDERVKVNNLAEERGLVVSGDVALQEAEDVLKNITTISQDEKAAILEKLKNTYSGEKPPSLGQTIQEDLNNEFSAAYANGTIDRANPTFQARKAIRDSIARQMDELGQAVTGSSERPYADIGNLIDVQGKLEGNFNQLRVNKAATKTGIESSPGRVPLTKFAAASKGIRKALTPFQKTQIEKLNQNVRRIFSEQPSRPPLMPLEQGTIDELIQGKTPTDPVTDLESQIQEVINGFPRELRGKNERSLAEAVLRNRANP